MDFVLPTLQYIKKNFFRLFLLSVLPAFVMLWGFSSIPDFLVNKAELGMRLKDIYPYFSIINQNSVALSIAVIFVLIIWAGVTMSYIQKSIRVNKFKLTNPLERLNESLFSVLPLGIILILLLELSGFLCSLFIMLAAKTTNVTSLVVFSSIITIFIYGVYFCMMAMFMFAVPCMMEVGYTLSAAISQSLKQVQKSIVKVGAVLFFLFFVTTFLKFAAVTIFPRTARIIIDGIINLFSFMYLCSLIVIGYNKINK